MQPLLGPAGSALLVLALFPELINARLDQRAVKFPEAPWAQPSALPPLPGFPPFLKQDVLSLSVTQPLMKMYVT